MANLIRNYDSQRCIDFSVTKCGVCYKPEKVNSTTRETIGILGLQINTKEMTLSLRRETDPYNSTMSGGLLSAKNFSVKFDKVYWHTSVNGRSYIARENSVLLPPTGANIKSEKAGEIPRVY